MEILYRNLVQHVLAAMLALQPSAPWRDSYEYTAERVSQAAIADPFVGKSGEDIYFTAALMTIWAARESRFATAVVGDSGVSYGLFQIQTTTAEEPKERLLDVNVAPSIALRLFHFSYRACAAHPADERLAQYAYGRDCEHRLELSRARVHAAQALVRRWRQEDAE
jgi:hypothetical protein